MLCGWSAGASRTRCAPDAGTGPARLLGRAGRAWWCVTAARPPRLAHLDRLGTLGDSDLWLRVEDDHVGYGDEPLWGYSGNIRSRMTQHDRVAAASELDVLIAGVLVVDPLLTEMILAVHGGSASDPADLELARERIHPATMAADARLAPAVSRVQPLPVRSRGVTSPNRGGRPLCGRLYSGHGRRSDLSPI
jgi:hypothetical protein